MAGAVTTVLWKEGLHFCINTESGHLMCDESALLGKEFPSSAELLMASLGSCIGSVLVVFAGRHEIDLTGMTVDLTWKLADDPHRIGGIHVSVNIPRNLADEQRQMLTNVAHSCLIHNTLTRPPEIATELVSTAPTPTPAK